MLIRSANPICPELFALHRQLCVCTLLCSLFALLNNKHASSQYNTMMIVAFYTGCVGTGYAQLRRQLLNAHGRFLHILYTSISVDLRFITSAPCRSYGSPLFEVSAFSLAGGTGYFRSRHRALQGIVCDADYSVVKVQIRENL